MPSVANDPHVRVGRGRRRVWILASYAIIWRVLAENSFFRGVTDIAPTVASGGDWREVTSLRSLAEFSAGTGFCEFSATFLQVPQIPWYCKLSNVTDETRKTCPPHRDRESVAALRRGAGGKRPRPLDDRWPATVAFAYGLAVVDAHATAADLARRAHMLSRSRQCCVRAARAASSTCCLPTMASRRCRRGPRGDVGSRRAAAVRPPRRARRRARTHRARDLQDLWLMEPIQRRPS